MERQQKRAGRPSRAEKRGSARDALLVVTHETMLESRSIELSVAEIAKRAGLNPALINYYFGSKEKLLLEVALQHQVSIEASLARLLRREISAQEKLKLHIRAIIRRNWEVPYLQRLHQKLLRESDDAVARDYGERLLKPLADFYALLVEQGIRERSFRAIDPMFLYFTILGTCDFVFTGISLKRAFNIDEMNEKIVAGYIDHTMKLVMSGIIQPNNPAEVSDDGSGR